MLAEGDRVPADAVLIEAQDLQADESLLTGESVPVRKAGGAPVADGRRLGPAAMTCPCVYSGAADRARPRRRRGDATGAAERDRQDRQVARGALETGAAAPADADAPPRAHLRRMSGRRQRARRGALRTLRGDWLDALLAGIALGMSMLPEEFPVVLTVFMAMGAWRISRARVLTRRAAAIETLGSATVLCTDKTGTLTQNRMTIAELRLLAGGASRRSSEDAAASQAVAELVEFGVLASAREPFDPMEKAFHALAARWIDTERRRAGWRR